ncbi:MULTISPECIES: methyltransferase [unclassified Pseudomonas]|uniref:methyltransferase n=1 Tax=unclassified Pseudomonas TaxID=196821 RepID=UPI0008E0D08C|nr:MULTISPECIES: methyltransferase [unclassified Pseudomonas]PMV27304.1 methyltransferase [Pseudomonas sp. FW305-3-2-15-C-TSA2]PMV32559.1 methyltransferase [Pseudomonas sp. DP16D-L5]PMV42273.1 methyltransferase [Pseudomonas sp. FW305-3-2-15-A-LB2]PMV49687.1 methyltransferase [Pseudomonas sp. FW305-3-2-15-C-R2A1]PMV55197.1 methyltransferase [Pseudomonas sp. FW305-3-2-15-C-LB1]
MPAKDVEARFQALDAFLIEHQGLWKPRPFTHLHLPWETQHPELAQWLRQRSLDDAETCHNHPHDLPAPAPFAQLAAHARALSAVDKLPTQPLAPARHRLNVDVPGRKWEQIEAFGSALQFAQAPTHWLDWCSGKGHLGRRLLQADQALTCLEYDPALIAAGQALSDHHGLSATHRLQDVMADVAIHAEHTPVALHACGDLHVRLLQLASAVGCKQLALAPCCYNRITADTYQPLSNAGRASTLQLSIDDLGLPLSETVTAGKRVRLQRDTSMARRLGFDQLQRELRGLDEYLPTPSLPARWLDKSFADYCRELANLKGLSTGEQDWAALEAHGWRRLAEVRNLELVRGLFRRPLEVWLVLDRALFLGENGYKVDVGTFCDPALTPRNLMVLAQRD